MTNLTNRDKAIIWWTSLKRTTQETKIAQCNFQQETTLESIPVEVVVTMYMERDC